MPPTQRPDDPPLLCAAAPAVRFHLSARVSCASRSPPRASRSPPRHCNARPPWSWRGRRRPGQAVLALFPELGLSAYSNEDLFQQDALLDASLAALAQLVEASRGLPPVLVVGLPLRARRPAVQLRGRAPSRADARRGAEDLSAELSRVLREAPVRVRRAGGSTTRSDCSGSRCPVRQRQLLFAATQRRRVRAACGDLRGRLGAVAAEHACGAGRRDGPREPVGEQHHGRQGRLSAPALRLAVGQVRRSVPVLGRRAGRVDDGSRVGWPRADLRERRKARRVSAISARRRAHHGGYRSRSPAAGAHALDEFQRLRAARNAAQLRRFRRVAFELDVPAGRVPLRRRVERFPYVPADPARRDERCAEVYDIQVDGIAQAAVGDRDQAGRASVFPAGSIRRRPRSSPCAHWTGLACRAATSSATRCRASPRAGTRSTMRTR